MRLPTALMTILTLAAFPGCGDGDSPTTPSSPPPPVPSATIQVTGNGNIIVPPALTRLSNAQTSSRFESRRLQEAPQYGISSE